MKTKFPWMENGATYCTGLNGERICTGSKMGRSDSLPDDLDAPIKLNLRRLAFVDGDYDQGGAYWGNNGAPIYCAFSLSNSVSLFIRASNRAHAKAQVRESLEKATFYR